MPGLKESQKLTIPRGTQTGKVFKLDGVGIPSLRGFGRGDEYVKVVVYTPTDLSEEEEQLLRQFAELRGENVAAKKKGLFNSLFHSKMGRTAINFRSSCNFGSSSPARQELSCSIFIFRQPLKESFELRRAIKMTIDQADGVALAGRRIKSLFKQSVSTAQS